MASYWAIWERRSQIRKEYNIGLNHVVSTWKYLIDNLFIKDALKNSKKKCFLLTKVKSVLYTNINVICLHLKYLKIIGANLEKIAFFFFNKCAMSQLKALRHKTEYGFL